MVFFTQGGKELEDDVPSAHSNGGRFLRVVAEPLALVLREGNIVTVLHVADEGPAPSISGVVRDKSQTLAKGAHKKGRMAGLLEEITNDRDVEVSKAAAEAPVKLGAVHLGPLELPF